jgi:hypothetical protein
MEKKFEKRPNSGALFAVKSKKNPNQPDYRGDLLIDLSAFEVVNNQITVSLSGWKKPMSGGSTFLSLQAQKPYVAEGQQTQQQQSNSGGMDDDIPF